MNKQITRKFDHEKGKLRDKAQNPDYRERFLEEGDHFDRRGTPIPKIITFRGSNAYLNRRPFYLEDKRSLIRTLETNVKFIFAGHVGIVAKLLKIPTIAEEVRDRFERTKNSILRAETIESVAAHPTNRREFAVVSFKCFLEPSQPLPQPIFEKYLAFSVKFPSAVQ